MANALNPRQLTSGRRVPREFDNGTFNHGTLAWTPLKPHLFS